MRIAMKSMISGKTHEMDLDVTPEQLAELSQPKRRLIQEIVPHLSAEEREFLKTGITPAEWEIAFPPEEEEV